MDAKRYQELEKEFFPRPGELHHGTTGTGLLPPISPASNTQNGGVYASSAHKPIASKPMQQRVSVRRGSKPSHHRKQHLNTLLSTGNPENPYESLVEAMPGRKQLPRRAGHKLELRPPSGLDQEVAAALEAQLLQFLSSNTSASRGWTDSSPPRSTVRQRAATHDSDERLTGADEATLRAAKQLIQATTPDQANIPQQGSRVQAGLETSNVLLPDLPNASGQDTASQPSDPVAATAHLGDSHMLRQAMRDTGPDVMGSHALAGLGATTTLASACAGALPVKHVKTEIHDTGVTLGQMFTERPTCRREVQLIAEWMEVAVAQLWAASATSVTELGVRAAVASHIKDQHSDQSLQAALDVLAGSPGPPPPPGPAFKKGSLAAQFAAFISSALLSQGVAGGPAWSSSHHMWKHVLQVVGVTAQCLIRQVAGACWEEGALLTSLWNMQTGLLDAGMAATQARAGVLEAEAEELREQVVRLNPLLDWERDACQEIEVLKQELCATKDTLQLAASERDALLRENDKIIIHYRKELRRHRKEARCNAWRLAKKLKNLQEQLTLMQRDREQLINAVTYTKGQATTIVTMVHGVNQQFGELQRQSSLHLTGGGDSEELLAIETGLQNMVTTVARVHDMTRDAEESHFTTEEAVTAVQAADDEADELIAAVLAEGDPETGEQLGPLTPDPDTITSKDGRESPDLMASLARLPSMANRKPGRPAKLQLQEASELEREGTLSPHSKLALEFANGDRSHATQMLEEAARVLEQSGDKPRYQKRPAALQTAFSQKTSHDDDHDDQAEPQQSERRQSHVSASSLASPTIQPAVSATAAPAAVKKSAPSLAIPSRASVAASAQERSPRPVSPSKPKTPRAQTSEASTQTDDLPRSASDQRSSSPQDGGAPSTHRSTAAPSTPGSNRRSVPSTPNKKAAQAPTQAPPTPPSPASSAAPTPTPHEPVDVKESAQYKQLEAMNSTLQDKVFDLEEQTRDLQRAVDQKSKAVHTAEMKVQTLMDNLDAKDQELIGIRQQADSTRGMYYGLRSKIEDLGMDPDNLKLPPPTHVSTPMPAAPVSAHKVAVSAAQSSVGPSAWDSPGDEDEDDVVERPEPVVHKKKKAAANAKPSTSSTTNAPTKPAGKQQAERSSAPEAPPARPAPVAAMSSAAPAPSPAAAPAPAPSPAAASQPASLGAKLAGVASKAGAAMRAAAAVADAGSTNKAAEPPAAAAAPTRATGKPKAAGTALSRLGGVIESVVVATHAAAAVKTPKAAPAPFLLGKERVAEKKVEQTGSERLAEAILKYQGIKPRTLDWLLKLIDGIYKGKMTSDDMRAKMTPPLEPLPLVDYMYQHLAGVYGTRDLVNQYSAQLVVTINQFIEVDGRIDLFQKLLMECWAKKALSVFLDGLRKLNEPARLPCCDFPPDWSPKKGGVPMVDLRKCLWVADKILMRRHSKTAYSFAAALAMKAEVVLDSELSQYFAAPGYYGPDVAQMKEYEKGRAEFRKIQITAFLQPLIEEYLRCEDVYMDVLPGIFKKWDQDSDHLMTQDDVVQLFNHVNGQGIAMESVIQESATFWKLALSLENEAIQDGLPNASASNPMRPGPRASNATVGVAQQMIGVQAFINASLKNDIIRGYVRLHKTPPAQVRIHNTGEEQSRILLQLLIKRHWELHGDAIKSYIPETSPARASMILQSQALEHEKDGARKAMALHGLLKMLIGQKVDRLVTQLSPDALAQAVDPEFEVSLTRMTHAVKVLYGANIIVVDELFNPDSAPGVSPTALLYKQRQTAQVFSLFNQARGIMAQYAVAFLKTHGGIKYWVQRWRLQSSVKAQSRGSTAQAQPGSNQATKSIASDGENQTAMPPVIAIPTSVSPATQLAQDASSLDV